MTELEKAILELFEKGVKTTGQITEQLKKQGWNIDWSQVKKAVETLVEKEKRLVKMRELEPYGQGYRLGIKHHS